MVAIVAAQLNRLSDTSERTAMTPSILERLNAALGEDSADSLFRCDRAIFTDPGFFELEMKHLFEGNWVYLAHESQIPNKNDYFTSWMGRQPIFIARSKDNGRLHQCLQSSWRNAFP